MNQSLVSVIMPNYNGEKFIIQAISSVIAQTYQNWELIIVDDCSSDNSAEIITPFLIDKRIKLIKNEYNLKTAGTRNKATEMAKGEYIAFLDSDDLWVNDKLERQLACFESNKQIALVYSYYDQMDEQGNDMGRIIRGKTKATYNDLLKTNSIGCLTAIYHVEKTGKRYFINHRYEDYLLWLFLLKDGFIAKGVPEVLARYRISGSSYSSNKLKAASWQWSIYRNVLKINLLRSVYYFICYAYNGIKKHY